MPPVRIHWTTVLLVIVVLPLVLYAGIEFGLTGVDYLFPGASVRCH